MNRVRKVKVSWVTAYKCEGCASLYATARMAYDCYDRDQKDPLISGGDE